MVSKRFANNTALSLAVPLWDRVEIHQGLVLLREACSRKGAVLLHPLSQTCAPLPGVAGGS